MSIYPFTLHPSEYHEGRTESPHIAHRVWLRLRKEVPELESRTWYAVGVEVDEEALEIHVYRDSLYGGLGDRAFTVSVKRRELKVDEQALLLVEEQREALLLAEVEIERQDNEAYKQRRQALAESLFPRFFNTQVEEQQP